MSAAAFVCRWSSRCFRLESGTSFFLLGSRCRCVCSLLCTRRLSSSSPYSCSRWKELLNTPAVQVRRRWWWWWSTRKNKTGTRKEEEEEKKNSRTSHAWVSECVKQNTTERKDTQTKPKRPVKLTDQLRCPRASQGRAVRAQSKRTHRCFCLP